MDDHHFRFAFAEQLRVLREDRGLRQAELGERARMPASSISHFETARRLPTIMTAVRIADALQVTMDALCNRGDVTHAPLAKEIDQLAPEDRAVVLQVVERLKHLADR